MRSQCSKRRQRYSTDPRCSRNVANSLIAWPSSTTEAMGRKKCMAWAATKFSGRHICSVMIAGVTNLRLTTALHRVSTSSTCRSVGDEGPGLSTAKAWRNPSCQLTTQPQLDHQ